MRFFEYINTLSNPEKTRNFSRFHSYSLEPFQKVLEIFSLPDQAQTHRISIVGTNGKGSLGHYLNQYLVGLNRLTNNVGYYSSPHLISPLERIQVQGNPADESILDGIFQSLSDKERKSTLDLTYFEAFTLFALLYFQKMKTSWDIFEAGLGGKLDATKLTNPDWVAVTGIGLDHTEILGDTVEKILEDKLQIAGTKTKKIFALQPDANQVKCLIPILERFSQNRNIALELIPRQNNYLATYQKMAERILKDLISPDLSFPNVPPPPGRMEVLNQNPLLVFDTAHNPSACQNLLRDIESIYPTEKWTLIVGILPDKDAQGIYENALRCTRIERLEVLTFPPFFEKKITSIPNIHYLNSQDEFLNQVKLHQKEKTHVLVVGSFRIYPILKAEGIVSK